MNKHYTKASKNFPPSRDNFPSFCDREEYEVSTTEQNLAYAEETFIAMKRGGGPVWGKAKRAAAGRVSEIRLMMLFLHERPWSKECIPYGQKSRDAMLP